MGETSKTEDGGSDVQSQWRMGSVAETAGECPLKLLGGTALFGCLST